MQTGFYGVVTTVSVCLIAGCAGYTSTVKLDEMPVMKDAYPYGRFYMENPPRNAFTGNPQTKGSLRSNAWTRTLTPLGSSRTNEVHVVKGLFTINLLATEFVYTDYGATKTTRKPVPDKSR